MQKLPIVSDASQNASLRKRLAPYSRSSAQRKGELIIFQGSEPNAFNLPGVALGFSTGLLAVIEGDDELAGIAAHELAHELFVFVENEKDFKTNLNRHRQVELMCRRSGGRGDDQAWQRSGQLWPSRSRRFWSTRQQPKTSTMDPGLTPPSTRDDASSCNLHSLLLLLTCFSPNKRGDAKSLHFCHKTTPAFWRNRYQIATLLPSSL
ncbi:MAG: M48 family metalloprotease [Pyrinomonadaceae bacterium]